MKVLIFQRIIPHYRIPIFKALSEKMDIVVCHGKELPGAFLKDEEGNLNFPNCFIKNWYLSKTKENLVVQNVVAPILKYHPKVIVSEFSLGILSIWILLALRPLFRYKLIFWSHGYKKRKFKPQDSFCDRVRLWLINASDGIILYGDKARKVLSRYVKHPEKLFVAPNTLNTNELLQIRSRCEQEGKQHIKNRWGLNHKYILIFIGRLLKDKQVDFLLRVFKEVQKKLIDSGLAIVGDGPERNFLQALTRSMNLKNVYFLGEITDIQKTGELLYISDLMIIPGRLGLSVVHAFCFDTPVISQTEGPNGPFHSPEVEYMKSGKTGFLTPCGDITNMVKTIIDILSNPTLIEKMKFNIRKTVKERCNLELMINKYFEAIEKVSKHCK